MRAAAALVLLWVCYVVAQAPGTVRCTEDIECHEFNYVCFNGSCVTCVENHECQAAYNVMSQCKEVKGERLCLHKELFPDFTLRDLLVSLLLLAGGALSAGAGVGGGGVFVPILMLIGFFDTKEALPLSSTLIGGAAVANVIQMWRRKHPFTPNRPLIDYDMAVLIGPLTLGGTVLGVILNDVSPAWLLLVLLAMMLGVTIYRSAKKGLQLRREEKAGSFPVPQNLVIDDGTTTGGAELQGTDGFRPLRDLDDPLEASEVDATEPEVQTPGRQLSFRSTRDRRPLTPPHEDDGGGRFARETFDDERVGADHSVLGDMGGVPDEADIAYESPEQLRKRMGVQEIIDAESRVPKLKVAGLFAVLIVVALFSLLKGGRERSVINIRPCGPEFWLFVWMLFPFLLLFTCVIGYLLVRKHRRKTELGFVFLKGDVQWTLKRTIGISIASVVAGLLASALGIGGGMVLTPVMLELKVLPLVAVSTSSFMLLFTSLSAVVQFMILGKLMYWYALWYFMVGLLSSIIGQTAINYLVERYKKQSLILFVLVLIITVSTVLLLWSSTRDLIEDIRIHSKDLYFQPLCN